MEESFVSLVWHPDRWNRGDFRVRNSKNCLSVTVNGGERLFMFELCHGDAARQQWQTLRYTLGQDSVAFTSTQLAAHLASTIMRRMLLIVSIIAVTTAQINLGQFSLQPREEGGFDLGMSQGGNVLGFGGHRALGVSGNSAGVGINGTDNVIVANERIGVDSGLNVRQGRGVDLLSMLQLGNPNPMHPGGQLGSLIDNVKNFFSSINGFLPRPWENQENAGPVDGSAGPSRRITSTESPFPTLVPRESEQWSMPQTTEEPDPFEFPKDHPRQLPGLVEMSRPS